MLMASIFYSIFLDGDFRIDEAPEGHVISCSCRHVYGLVYVYDIRIDEAPEGLPDVLAERPPRGAPRLERNVI